MLWLTLVSRTLLTTRILSNSLYIPHALYKTLTYYQFTHKHNISYAQYTPNLQLMTNSYCPVHTPQLTFCPDVTTTRPHFTLVYAFCFFFNFAKSTSLHTICFHTLQSTRPLIFNAQANLLLPTRICPAFIVFRLFLLWLILVLQSPPFIIHVSQGAQITSV